MSTVTHEQLDWHGENYAWWNAMAQMAPRTYACSRIDRDNPPSCGDDVRTSAAWEHAPWSQDFGDIQGASLPAPRFSTRMKLMWDDESLWFGCWMDEPQLVATLTDKNSVIYHDNDIEVFLDPDGDNHHYYEFEMNALNTLWELVLEKPYKDGGPCINPYNLDLTASSVLLDGALNDPTAPPAAGWSAVSRFALADLQQFHTTAGPSGRAGSLPQAGDFWRANFSRVEWRWLVNEQGQYEKVAGQPEDNWTWSPQGIIDMHRPEQWGYLLFCGDGQPADPSPSIPDPTFAARRAVMEVYHLQRDYHAFYKRFAASAEELGISPPPATGPAGTSAPQPAPSPSNTSAAGFSSRCSAVSIVVDAGGAGYEATCDVVTTDGTTASPRRLVVHTRQDSKIWVTARDSAGE